MHAAFPVNDQDDLTGLGIGIDDDFVNECSNEAFLQSDIRVRIPPDRLEVRCQMLECFSGGDHGLTAAVHVLIDALLGARGFTDQEALTPRELERLAVDRLQVSREETGNLTSLFEEARYSEHALGEPDRARAMDCLGRIQAALEA